MQYQGYHYKKEEDLKSLCQDIRRSPYDETEVIMDLGQDLYIRCSKPRALVNAYIFQVCDNYKLSKRVRNEFVFEGSYRKGQPQKYMNHLAKVLRDDRTQLFQKEIFLSWVLADVKSCFYAIALEVNGVVTIDHSLVDYVKAYEEHNEFRDMIMRPGFDKNSNPYEVYDTIAKMRDQFKDKIKIQPIYDFFKSGTKINEKQVQMFFCYGLPPDYINMRATLPPLNEGLLGGFRDIYSQFIIDMIARLARIAEKNDVKEVGTISKRISVVIDNVKLNLADSRAMICDCGNPYLFKIKITEEKYNDLAFYCGKEMYDPTTHKFLGFITLDSKELIGKEVWVRSFMTCMGDVICQHCFGYNWKYVSDTPLFKSNLSAYILAMIAGVMQGVISIKHFTTAILKRIYVTFGEEYQNVDLMDFMKETDYFTNLAFDKLCINPKYEWDVIPVKSGEKMVSRKKRDPKTGQVIKDDKGNPIKEKIKIDTFDQKLHIEGVPVELTTYVYPEFSKENNWVRILIPNDSVLIKGKDLKQAVNSHSNAKTGDFDAKLLYSGKLTLVEQVELVYNYIRTKIEADHFIYYEALVCGLIRDMNDLGSGITDTTTQIKYIHANQALTKPNTGRTISTKLQHGYVHANMNTINTETEATEIDILHQNTGNPRSVHYFHSNEKFLQMILETFQTPIDLDMEEDDEIYRDALIG